MADSGPAPRHVHGLRVYYEDTDVAGIVYYANHLKYAERARTEMMRASGASYSEMIETFDTAFAVSRCEVDYLKPARLDDLLSVETRVLEVGAAVVDLDQRIAREGELLACLKIRIACLNRKGRPQRLPDPVRAALASYRISEELV